jgi:hypothetical protein
MRHAQARSLIAVSGYGSAACPICTTAFLQLLLLSWTGGFLDPVTGHPVDGTLQGRSRWGFSWLMKSPCPEAACLLWRSSERLAQKFDFRLDFYRTSRCARRSLGGVSFLSFASLTPQSAQDPPNLNQKILSQFSRSTYSASIPVSHNENPCPPALGGWFVPVGRSPQWPSPRSYFIYPRCKPAQAHPTTTQRILERILNSQHPIPSLHLAHILSSPSPEDTTDNH